MTKNKLYQYTILLEDGTELPVQPMPRMNLRQLQGMVGGSIELVPKPYYEHQKWGRCTIYVNEDGREADPRATENKHFKNLGDGFNVVGIALKEEVYHE